MIHFQNNFSLGDFCSPHEEYVCLPFGYVGHLVYIPANAPRSHSVYKSPTPHFSITSNDPLLSASPFLFSSFAACHQGATSLSTLPLIMKLTPFLPILSLLPPLTLAVPRTRYSTVTIIPFPPFATVIQYHPPHRHQHQLFPPHRHRQTEPIHRLPQRLHKRIPLAHALISDYEQAA